MEFKKIVVFGMLLGIFAQAYPMDRKLFLSGRDCRDVIQLTEEDKKFLLNLIGCPDNLYEQHEAFNAQENRADFAGFSLAWYEEFNFIYVNTQTDKNSEEKRAFLNYGLKNDNFATMVIDNDQQKFWMKLKDDEKVRAKTYALYLVNKDARYKGFSLVRNGLYGGDIWVSSPTASNSKQKRAFLDYMLKGDIFENMRIMQHQKVFWRILRDNEQEREKTYALYPLNPVVKDAKYEDKYLMFNGLYGGAIWVFSPTSSNKEERRAFLDYMLEGNKFENMSIKQHQKQFWRILSDNEQEREKTYALYC